MSSARRRYQFRIHRQLGQRLELYSRTQNVSVSVAIGTLVERGLAQDGDTELDTLLRLCSAISSDAESLTVDVSGLDERESGRFRYLLGHLQQMQVMVTELLQIQRVLMAADRPIEYAKAVDLARRQATEDAGVYRASLAAGASLRRLERGTTRDEKSA